MFIQMNDRYDNMVNTKNITSMSKKNKEYNTAGYNGIVIYFNGVAVGKWFEYESIDTRDQAYVRLITGSHE